jgi:hypothetical protein
MKGIEEEEGKRGRKKKLYADEYGDGTGLEPWWFQCKKEKIFEFLHEFKYPLYKWLS